MGARGRARPPRFSARDPIGGYAPGVQLVPISDGENHRVAGLGNVLVCVYWGEPSLAALHDRVEWVERTIERGPPGPFRIWSIQ